MDPNANLAEQRAITTRILDGGAAEGDIERLAELVDALDAWLSRGGFLPAAWLVGAIRP